MFGKQVADDMSVTFDSPPRLRGGAPILRGSIVLRSILSSSVAAALAIAILPASPAVASTSDTVCSTAAVLGIHASTGSLTRWTDPTPLQAGGFTTPTTTPTWTNARLLASDSATGTLYGVFTNGTLRQYTFSGGAYTAGTQIGTGWGSVTRIIPMGNGVIYATFNDGTMRWYRFVDGTSQPGSATQIGSGWQNIGAIASGGQGILYAVNKADGKLFWYKRSNWASPSGTWNTRREVGSSGWNAMTTLLGAGDGLIYAISDTGTLRWYNHTAPQTGDQSWAAGSSTTLGQGWSTYRALTVNPNACTPLLGTPAPNPYPSATTTAPSATARTQYVRNEISVHGREGDCFVGSYRAGEDSRSVHNTGNALDCTISDAIGYYPSASQKLHGDQLAAWLRSHADSQKVISVIWYGRIWTKDRAAEGWRTYTGGSGVTTGHYDHVHVAIDNPYGDDYLYKSGQPVGESILETTELLRNHSS